MVGFDFSRQPHPAALALVSPLISGAVFLAGLAYFRWDSVVKMLGDSNLTNTAKLVIALIISYAIGLLLTTLILGPFLIISYLGGAVIGFVTIMRIRRRSQQIREPSKQPSFRRAVQVALGPSLIPRPPQESAAELTQRLIAHFTAIATGEMQVAEDARQKLQQEALNLFSDDYDLQWEHIHSTLYKIENRKHPLRELGAYEPTLSIAGSILIWGWLSFKVPPPLHLAAIITFVVCGATLFFSGLIKAVDHVDGISIQAFMFEEILDQRRKMKTDGDDQVQEKG